VVAMLGRGTPAPAPAPVPATASATASAHDSTDAHAHAHAHAHAYALAAVNARVEVMAFFVSSMGAAVIASGTVGHLRGELQSASAVARCDYSKFQDCLYKQSVSGDQRGTH